MLINSNFFENDVINTDVCVIGSGPAGMSLISNFLNDKKKVIIIESGDLNYKENNQELNYGNVDSFGNYPHQNYALNRGRLRMIGGTSNVWAGWSGPLLDHDFKKKNWIKNSGWPISLSDLNNYYFEAQKLLKLSNFIYDKQLFDFYSVDKKKEILQSFENNFWQFSKPPLNFKKEFINKISNSKYVDLYYNCTATEIVNENQNKVDQIICFNNKNFKFKVKSNIFVLACGAIENASLMLNSTKSLKNYSMNSNVGKYFMEHPHCTIGHGITNNNFLNTYKKRKIKEMNNIYVMPGISLKKNIIEKEKINNCITVFVENNLLEVRSAVITRYDLTLRKKTQKAKNYFNFYLNDLKKISQNLFTITSNFFFTKKKFFLISRLEQSPHQNSQVYLSNNKNKFDKFIPNLNWKMTLSDLNTLKINFEQIKYQLEKENKAKIYPSNLINNLNIQSFKDDNWLPEYYEEVYGVGHHMGTTRMSKSLEEGVVDENLKVHGLKNLYIAGSSVFPTVGCVNPTLTIVALSLRLYQHLNKMIK